MMISIFAAWDERSPAPALLWRTGDPCVRAWMELNYPFATLESMHESPGARRSPSARISWGSDMLRPPDFLDRRNPTMSDSVNDVSAALGRVPSGIFILTTGYEGRATGMLASWVQQAGFEPPMVTVAVRRDRFVAEWIAATGPSSPARWRSSRGK
jgi:hypothetical protein